jgi:acetylornithine deacetylase/succinyl-diaminopimelate desuccinylase-like protein
VASQNANSPDLHLELSVYLSQAGHEISSDHFIMQTVSESHKRVRGAANEKPATCFWSDAILMGQAGIPTVNYGLGGEREYWKDGYEATLVNDLVDHTKVYALSIAKVCTTERGEDRQVG